MSVFNGELLAELRRDKKITGRELAGLAHCSNVTISRIENGHQQPTTYLDKRLARALGEPVERLYVGGGAGAAGQSMGHPTPDGPDDADTQMAIVLDALRRLSPVLRAKAIGYILGLASSGSPPAAQAAASLAESAERTRQATPSPPDDPDR